jgi:hypothetical protein
MGDPKVQKMEMVGGCAWGEVSLIHVNLWSRDKIASLSEEVAARTWGLVDMMTYGCMDL